jgi:glycosyltransferase involved in cell wall biosynthesis
MNLAGPLPGRKRLPLPLAGEGRPTRVLLLAEGLSLAGGVERFVCALANHLAQQGMDVAVGTVDTPREQVRYPLAPAVRLLAGAPASAPRDARAAATRAGRAWHLLRTQWRTGRALARLMRAEQPDAIVLNALTTACSTLPFAPLLARRTICCDHNHFDARSRPWRLLRRCLYPRVAAVVSLTAADAPRFAALNPRTDVIYNASALQAEVPATPDSMRVLAVGRHVAQKGFDLLLEAWPEVLRACPRARLRIVGDGPLRGQAQRLAAQLGIAGSIEWCDPTPRIEQEYRNAAVFVLPSRYEGMPLALLEAQALGVPAVAFDCPTGPAEILADDTGVLVPALDTAALAHALVHVLGDRGLRERMGHAAIARSRRFFSPQTHAERWTALVRRVALEGARA